MYATWLQIVKVYRCNALCTQYLYHYICLLKILKECPGMMWGIAIDYVLMVAWWMNVCSLSFSYQSYHLCSLTVYCLTCECLYMLLIVTVCATVGNDIYIAWVEKCIGYVDILCPWCLLWLLFFLILLSFPLPQRSL